MERMVINKHGKALDLDDITGYMDDEIRESIINYPCDSDQEWLAEYERRHEAKYGAEWELSKANPVW